MRQYRAVLDEISEKFMKVYSSEKYYELREILDRQSLLYTEAYGGDQGGNYKKNKLQELKEKMGNAILKQAKDYIKCMNNKVDVPNFGTKEKTTEEMPIDLAQLEEIENVFIINEQEQLIEEIESVEQVGEAQEIEEKEYDLKLSVKPQINISETLQKELDAAKAYFGEESSENIMLKDKSEEFPEDLMKCYVDSKEIKYLLKQALGAKVDTEKQKEIFNLIRNVAEKKNNPFVKELLGEMYLYGNLVEVNSEVAREYFTEALEIFEVEYDSLEEMQIISQGKNKENRFLKNYVAFCIGKQYDRGWGIEESPGIALEWYEKADNMQAQYTLGKIYLTEGEFYNLEKGINYLERSASQGNEFAKYQLAKEYLNSDSEAYNPKKGMTYLNELAEGGNEWAQLKMGCEYIKGEHVEKNYFQATEWLNKSADQGNKYAEEILNDLNVRQLKTNRYGSQRGKRYNTMGELDKAMVALRKSLYETQKEMRYNMMIYEQDIRTELDGYVFGEGRG